MSRTVKLAAALLALGAVLGFLLVRTQPAPEMRAQAEERAKPKEPAKPEGEPAEERAKPEAEPAEEPKNKKKLEVVLDPELDEEFTAVEMVLQIAFATGGEEGKEPDLKSVESMGLSVAETDRQKAYVHLRIAEMSYQRGDPDLAIESLKTALPLADGERSKDSLYFRVLTSLLTVYERAGRAGEAEPYLDIYREIMTGGADPWERPAGSQDVIHMPSGIRLPMKLDLFLREKLIVFDESGRDAGATYRGGTAQFPELTVYLVADFEESALEHFDGAAGHLLSRFEGVKVRSRGPYRAETDAGWVEGFAAQFDVPAEGYETGLGSDLYVFVRQGTLIKFRVTFHAANRDDMPGVMARIFRAFDWP